LPELAARVGLLTRPNDGRHDTAPGAAHTFAADNPPWWTADRLARFFTATH
jgi:hypothetical protein